MRHALPVCILLCLATPALAQEATDPTGICGFVNFNFCPQPASPPPLLPDPNVVPPRPPAPASAPAHHVRRHRRVPAAG